MSEYKRLNRTLVSKGTIIDYYRDELLIPNGHIGMWDHIEHKGAAAALAVLDDGRILMVRQYRNSIERDTLEIPAGGLNPNEDPMKAAARGMVALMKITPVAMLEKKPVTLKDRT